MLELTTFLECADINGWYQGIHETDYSIDAVHNNCFRIRTHWYFHGQLSCISIFNKNYKFLSK